MNRQGDRPEVRQDVRKTPRNAWITESERTLVSSPIMSVHELACRSSEDARQMKFYTLRSRDWCNIIPITESGKIVLIKQFRIGINRHTLEIPGGVVDPTDPDPQSTALRELTEETGYAPLPGTRCENLGWVYPNPAIQNNRTFSFVVGPVRKTREQNLDPGEMIETCEIGPEEIPRLILENALSSEDAAESGGLGIRHGLMLNTFFFLMLRSPKGPESLVQALRDFR